MLTLARRSLAALLVAHALVTSLRAAGQEPGSLLIFPEYDNRPGQSTLITITNTNGDQVSGGVRVHFVYVHAASCLETDLVFNLTPRDTISFYSIQHTPAGQRGYAYGWALDKLTGKSIDFDHLIGSELRVDGVSTFDWSVQALAFQGRPGPGLDTDLDHDGHPDLDGLEYDRAPNKIYVPRFLAQYPDRAKRDAPCADLILFRPLGPTNSTATAGFLIWNNNEEVFSASYSFSCWTRARLLSISGSFGQSFLSYTNYTPGELLGPLATQAGWFEVRSQTATSSTGQTTSNPQIFGVLVEQRPQSAADLPFVEDL